MSAKTGEELSAIRLLQGLQQMKAGNGASGTIGLAGFSIARQDQSGTSIALDHSGGNNSNHAAVPAVAIEHQAVRLALCGIAIATLLSFFTNSCLFALPLVVALVQLG